MTKRKQNTLPATGKISVDQAFQQLQKKAEPWAACELFNAALRTRRVRLWQNDTEVPPSYFTAYLQVVINSTPDGWTASMAMNRAVEPWPCEWSVSAADVEKLQLHPKSGGPPRRRTGPANTHDWHSIDGEIARRCIDPKTKRVRVPKNESKLAQEVLTWCQEKGWDEPADSAMREAVKRVCAALRQV
jgi:hypothetical protein